MFLIQGICNRIVANQRLRQTSPDKHAARIADKANLESMGLNVGILQTAGLSI